MGTGGLGLAERRSRIEAAREALSGLGGVLHEASGSELGDEAGRRGAAAVGAARAVVTADALVRGEVAEWGVNPHAWVREHAPSLRSWLTIPPTSRGTTTPSPTSSGTSSSQPTHPSAARRNRTAETARVRALKAPLSVLSGGHRSGGRSPTWRAKGLCSTTTVSETTVSETTVRENRVGDDRAGEPCRRRPCGRTASETAVASSRTKGAHSVHLESPAGSLDFDHRTDVPPLRTVGAGGYGEPMISVDEYLDYCDKALDGFVAIARELGDRLVNERLDIPGSNTAYGLVTHCAGVMAWWAGRVNLGVDVPRDRDAELRATGTVDELVVALESARQRLHEDARAAQPAAVPAVPPDHAHDLTETQGEVLMHVYEELAQHLGQLEVTRDVLLSRNL
jgi:hypothetical protein